MSNRGPHQSVKRLPSSRSAAPRVLVVCEGEHTEPHYFNALKDHLRLNTLVVKGTAGVDPRTLVETATKEARRETRLGERYDFVYCVFDRDTHPQFEEASKVAQDRKFRLARSWPCFEYWLLLHFEFSRAPYMPKRNVSPCDDCIRNLRKHLPDYGKGDRTTFEALQPRLEAAIANAKKGLVDAEGTNEKNPSTEVHKLVEHLHALATRSCV